MQLDTTIEQRLKELEQVNDEIEGARNEGNQYEEMTQKSSIEMLASRLEKTKNMFEILKFQNLSKRYDDLATSNNFHILINLFLDRFKSTMREDVALKTLEDVRTHNAIIEEVLDSIRKENPQFDVIFSRIIGW